MTDEEIIDVLTKIKMMCLQRFLTFDIYTPKCEGCKFEVYKPSKKRNTCQITQLFGRLSADPCDWKMSEVEEVLKK